MDKRHISVLLVCLLCSSIIALILLIAWRASQPKCELIIIDQNVLISKGLANFLKATPERASDSSLLIKMSAHLEYNLVSAPNSGDEIRIPSADSTSFSQSVSGPASASAGTSGSSPAFVSGGGQSIQMGVGQQSQPIFGAPSGSVDASSKKPAANNSIFWGPSGSSGNSLLLNNATNSNYNDHKPEKRFLPLQLHKVIASKLEYGRQRYTLEFNCSKVIMIFVRASNRVHVEQVTLELEVSNKKRSSCELQLPKLGAFGVDVSSSNLAHYQCDRALRFSCFYKSSRNSTVPQNAILLADLYIHALEYQVSMNSSAGSAFDMRLVSRCQE